MQYSSTYSLDLEKLAVLRAKGSVLGADGGLLHLLSSRSWRKELWLFRDLNRCRDLCNKCSAEEIGF